MDDAHILHMLLDRAENAPEALAEAYGKRLYATAMNILGDPRDAEECVNDTYLALWNAIPPKRPDPLCAYAYRVGRNIALKRLRSSSALKRSNGYDLSLDELSGCIPGGSGEDILDVHALGVALNAFLATLARTDRIMFMRRYWFGDSVREIAARFGIRENAVSVKLSRIRGRLKDYLEKEGFSV